LVELTLEDGGSFGFLRLFRVARIFKIVNKGYQMQQLLTTFVQSFKALPYVVILLGLAFFMFAILGMNLFGDIVITDDFSKPLNTYSNFGSFGISLLTLFKCITGESWHAVMATCYEEKGWLALPFFVTFVILCNFLMINLFIAVIMDNFQYLTQDVSTLNVHHLKRFSQTWSELDPAGAGRLPPGNLMELFKRMPPPLGFGRHCSERLAWINLMKMNPAMDKHGLVSFNSALLSIVRFRLRIHLDSVQGWDHENTALAKTIRKIWPILSMQRSAPEPSLVDIMLPPPTDTIKITTAGQLFAIHWCQRILRNKIQSQKKKRRQFVAGPADALDVSMALPRIVSLQRSESMDSLADTSV